MNYSAVLFVIKRDYNQSAKKIQSSELEPVNFRQAYLPYTWQHFN
jgi:hypothetical protein